jgi:hypothetical protein
MPKKPSGRIGPIQISETSSGPIGEWKEVRFPDQKEEQEQLVLSWFLAEMRRRGAKITNHRRNEENNLDFTLEMPSGPVLLELTEVMYKDQEGEPYKSESARINSYLYAEHIRDAIMKKSYRYGEVYSQPIHLLTYITHWRFYTSEVVIRLAQNMLLHSRPIMENVFFLEPRNETEAYLRVLYPSRNPLNGHSQESFKEHWYLNLHPGKWERFA